MSLEQVLESLPSYAKDLRINLTALLKQVELTERQTWGAALACALAARNPQMIVAVASEAESRISPEEITGAKTAAAIMAMNNVYYRFRRMVPEDRYGAIPARLRMQALRSHGADPADFELWCLAVSALNNCAACVGAHERAAVEKGITPEVVVAVVRIASVVQAIATVLDAEAAKPAVPAAIAAG